FDALELLHRRAVELIAHEVDFLDSHAMLAAEGPADVDAVLEDLFGRAKNGLNLRFIAIVVKKNWVDVAIAGVKHVGNLQVIAFADFIDALKDFGQFRSRHTRILRAITRRNSPNRAER